MNILTFDIEEWFHILDHETINKELSWEAYESRIEENLERILELLYMKNQKATFFCLGWIGKKYPNLIKKIDDMGFEIGTHSNIHTLAYTQNKKDFKRDLKESIDILENITNKKVKYYRAPGFSLKKQNKWVFEELILQGIEIDCSIFPAKRAHGGFEDFPQCGPVNIISNGKSIKELPINIFSKWNKSIIFSGGGYFRIIPYPIIKYLFNKSDYVMTYFHPRDFDKTQPIIKDLSFYRKIKCYVGLKTSFQKLEKLIEDFNFIDIKQANERIIWNERKTIDI